MYRYADCYGQLHTWMELAALMFLSEGDINLVSKVILLMSRSEPTKAITTGYFFYIILFDLCCSVTLATLKDSSTALQHERE